MTRAIATWRVADDGVSTRVVSVATCGSCRARLGRLEETRTLRTTPMTGGQRRFRVWDATAATAVLAVGCAVATAAGWMGPWAWWVALGLGLLTVPVHLAARRIVGATENGSEARWAASDEARQRSEEEARMRDAWRRFSDRLHETTGFSTELREGAEVRCSIDEDAIAEPATWADDGGTVRYVVRRDGAVEVRPLERDA